jgi:hypothetical protein
VIERYRFPIEPLIVLMVAYLCVRWFGNRRALQTIGAPGETDARATPAACARR